ncbi:putative hydrolase [Janibacter sp. HTCC2649]|uniref:HAD family hydrolase n=1 Tax=Janibacter sp. HTCC2649 TaxID=313589 RepID=UPI000066ECD4|nr:HAD-IA family hydrolase [Janibacter sp. HTCC2649]EAP99346.1 putative hydrolase [Janibacter sp. HTCC2649]
MTVRADIDIVVDRPLDPARPVSVLLWDADGVIQHPRHEWAPKLDAWGGPGFAEAVFAAEVPALRGEAPFHDILAGVLDDWPEATASVGDLLELWEQVDGDEEAVRFVQEVAASGVTCVLATNQQDHRKAYLRRVFGYDAVFARSFYSCDMGARKPELAYFERVLEALDVPAEQVGFVDDVEANVEAARQLGIRAVHHDPTSGVAGLRTVLGWPA